MSPDPDAAETAARSSSLCADELDTLAALAEGLAYSSEGDHPFTTVRLEDDAPQLPLTPERLRTLLQLPAATPLRVTTVARVLERHTDLTHPDDHAAQSLRPRYERLQQHFEGVLKNSVAARVGQAPGIEVWLLGRTDLGELVGYRTVAVET